MKALPYILAAVLLLAGCRTARHIPVQTTRTDSVYIDRLLRDSVWVKDSVWVERWHSGDTVYVTKEAVRYKYRDRWRTDTVATVQESKVKVPVAVERELTWWEQARLNAFWWLVAAIAALAWLAKKR